LPKFITQDWERKEAEKNADATLEGRGVLSKQALEDAFEQREAARQAELEAIQRAAEARAKVEAKGGVGLSKQTLSRSEKRKKDESTSAIDLDAGLHPWADHGRKKARQLAIKEQQRHKVALGQTFEGRTWKSEAEMVLRQQYD
jgi:hypothetical protein